MKTLYKALLTVTLALSASAAVRAQSISFGFSTGSCGFGSFGFSFGYPGYGLGYYSGYAPYCGYGYGYGYGGCYQPYYSSYYCSPVTYSPWYPVYAASFCYSPRPYCYPYGGYYGYNNCGNWNGWYGNGCGNGWYGGGYGCGNGSGYWASGWNGNGNGNWNGGSWASMQQQNGRPIVSPTAGGSQAGAMVKHPINNGRTTAAGGRPFLNTPNPGRTQNPANGQIARGNANGYRTIHSLGWNGQGQTVSVPRTGNGVGQTMAQTPIKGVRQYQPVRSPAWSPSHANYSVPVRNIPTVSNPTVRSTAYQPVQSSPAWNAGNRVVSRPATGNAPQRAAPAPAWKGANQVVRAPSQGGSPRSMAAPHAGNFRPSGGGGNFMGGNSGFSGRSFGGYAGSFGGRH